MYNRYIPQPDGSFCRNRMPEPPRPVPAKPTPQKPEAVCPPPPPEPQPCNRCSQCAARPARRPEPAGDSFLRHLLPKDFDTGDLLIVLLLLIMAGDSEEGRNNAILTLALYFLM